MAQDQMQTPFTVWPLIFFDIVETLPLLKGAEFSKILQKTGGIQIFPIKREGLVKLGGITYFPTN